MRKHVDNTSLHVQCIVIIVIYNVCVYPYIHAESACMGINIMYLVIQTLYQQSIVHSRFKTDAW